MVRYFSLSAPETIERRLSAAVNLPLHLVCTKFTSDISQLDRTWRGRRKALGKLLTELHLGPSEKADDLCFPQQRVSLSHSGCWSIALGTSSMKPRGIGIDFESNINMDAASTRLFLSQRERMRLGANTSQALRIWSIKEAIFKSDPDNNNHRVWNYELFNPASHRGRAFRDGCNKTFYYFSLILLEGVLAVSVCTGRNPT